MPLGEDRRWIADLAGLARHARELEPVLAHGTAGRTDIARGAQGFMEAGAADALHAAVGQADVALLLMDAIPPARTRGHDGIRAHCLQANVLLVDQRRIAGTQIAVTEQQHLRLGVVRVHAQYKGTVTINNSGSYGFMLTAIDGQISGGGDKDRFRIKIWDIGTDVIIYDNQPGSGDDAALGDPTILKGGSIVIHKREPG